MFGSGWETAHSQGQCINNEELKETAGYQRRKTSPAEYNAQVKMLAPEESA